MSFRRIATALLAIAAALPAAAVAQADTREPVYGIHSMSDQSLVITAGDGSHVVLDRWRHAPNQRWDQVGESQGYFQLRNLQTGQCLAVAYSDPDGLVSQYECNPEYNDQWWRWIRGVDGLQLLNQATRKVASTSHLLPGAPVTQAFPGDPDADWLRD